MKQGTAAALPETWAQYPSVEAARGGAKLMYHNDRVLRVMMVTDTWDHSWNGLNDDRRTT